MTTLFKIIIFNVYTELKNEKVYSPTTFDKILDTVLCAQRNILFLNGVQGFDTVAKTIPWYFLLILEITNNEKIISEIFHILNIVFKIITLFIKFTCLIKIFQIIENQNHKIMLYSNYNFNTFSDCMAHDMQLGTNFCIILYLYRWIFLALTK